MITTADKPADKPAFSIKSIIAPLLAVMIGMIMVLLDTTVINVAVPTLERYFNSPLETIRWAITGYTLALATVIPLAGWMTDKFGAKQIFLITIAFFMVGSILCTLSQSPGQLVFFRIIQGIGGGMVAPIGMAMAFRLAPPEKKGAVMGVLGIPMLVAPATGPLISGWLIGIGSWHWIFFINVPIGIAAIAIGIKYLPKTERRKTATLDILGMILGPIAFTMLTYGVSEGGLDWGSKKAITGLIIGGVALILFIISELRHKQPLLELRVFKSFDFIRGIFLSWLLQISMFVSVLLLPLYQQGVLGRTPLVSASIALPSSLGALIFSPLSGRLADKLGARPLAVTGLSFVSIAVLLLSRVTIHTPPIGLMIPMFLMGSGMGLSMMTINTHVLQSAPRDLISRVTPLTSATQQVVVSFAIAAFTGYLTSRIGTRMVEAGPHADKLKESALAFGDTYFILSWFAICGVVLAFFLRRPRSVS